MKALLVSLFFFSSLAFAQVANVQVKYNYDFTGKTICTATVTTNCFDHFETLDGNNALLGSQKIPAGAVTTGPLAGLSGTVQMLGFGSMPLREVAVYKDKAGARVASDPLKSVTTVFLQPDSPSDLSAQQVP